MTGRAVSLSAADDEEKVEESRLLDDAPSRTPMRVEVAVNEGFCHVGSRFPNAESATPDPPSRTDRWIGGSPDHAPAARPEPSDAPWDVPPDTASPADGTATAPPSPPPPPTSAASASTPPSSPRLRSLSKNPTAQPSAPASVTKDAIWSA
ncbi:hypothetical protein ACWFRJ_41535 [Streptomyces sp. NPDC055239]